MENTVLEIVKTSKVCHPVAKAAEKGNRYWTDFLSMTSDYEKVLTPIEYTNFLKKSKLNCPITAAEYLQFASEATIVDYCIRQFNNFRNEPKYNQKKNPECSFEYEGRTVNIEVKCPDYSKRIEQEHSTNIKVFAPEPLPSKDDLLQAETVIQESLPGDLKIQRIDRLDNKLKDYLVSANAKFPPSSTDNFNILVIALDIIQDLDEWYTYLFGEKGIFTERPFINDRKYTAEQNVEYNNVDAILLTNVQHGHMSDDINLDINCWHLENYVSLLFLDPRKAHMNGLEDYYSHSAINLFGDLTFRFFEYQWKLDEQIIERTQSITSLDLSEDTKRFFLRQYYLQDKLTNLQIIQEWCRTLENNSL